MRERLWPWLTASLVLSIAAYLTPVLQAQSSPIRNNEAFATALSISYMFSAAWLVALILGLLIHRWRGLWLLVGLPAALFWPAIMESLSIRLSPGG
jgi:phosphatidylserine synthase